MERKGTPFTPGSGVLWLPRAGITRSHPTVQGLLPQSPEILYWQVSSSSGERLFWCGLLVRSKINFRAMSAKETQRIEFPEVPLEWRTDDVCCGSQDKGQALL